MLVSRERRDEAKMQSIHDLSSRQTTLAIKALNLCNELRIVFDARGRRRSPFHLNKCGAEHNALAQSNAYVGH
jgi:hypothetical protein